ncbi:GATOR complex protein NPRL3-like isoform X2 [Panonychus citri]|uniref:GATOR complex protein NPRL3-like isoform X2 n=1 Tax=Panonychus citri TaxID=50023 RepID=UPI002306E7A1|nr:GATOR complex protein NPRL3-like isoform X2 [Panonychus citri]
MSSSCNRNQTDYGSNLNSDRDDFLLGIFLVKAGSIGDSLLFRYPYTIDDETTTTTPNGIGVSPSRQDKKSKNPFALIVENVNTDSNSSGPGEDNCRTGPSSRPNKPSATYCFELDPVSTVATTTTDVNLETVVKLPDRVVSTLFAVKNELCGKKIEIKINDVRFVGHPLSIGGPSSHQTTTTPQDQQHSSSSSSSSSSTSTTPQPTSKSKDIVAFNVVFALRANASHEVVNSFHKCSSAIAAALKKEEDEKAFLSKEAKGILTVFDEISSPSDELQTSPYSMILEKSRLAIDLKKIFEDLKNLGTVQLKLNKSTDLNLCIPQIVHRLTLQYHRSVPLIGPRELTASFGTLRPYHALLLLRDPVTILSSISDNRLIFKKILSVVNPTKNLITIAREAQLTYENVMKATCQLVYWAKATLIFPLAESNVYVIHPLAPTQVDCPLVEKFKQAFTDSNLLRFLSEFSLGTSIDQLRNPLHNSDQHIQLVNQIIWLLKHRLITQLHTYVYLLPVDSSSSVKKKSNIVRSTNDTVNSDDHNHHQIASNDTFNNRRFSNFHSNDSPNNFSGIDETNEDSDYLMNDASSLSINYERAIHLLRELGLRDYECESICQVPASKKHEDLTMFAKLFRFFDGKHHLEHIMHYENVKRSQLLAIIDKFRDVLFTCQHEDKTIFQLCPYLYE